MAYHLDEVVLGALLHDIGKLMQRAFGSLGNLVWQTYDMASTLCPKGRYDNYTHQHVLFTNAFFDWMKQAQLVFPATLDTDRITHVASFHHQPDNAPEKAVAWICALADRYSAGMDRKSEDDQDPSRKAAASFRQTPMKSIFDEVVLFPDRPEPLQHAYGLGELLPYEPNTLLPKQWQGVQKDLPDAYLQVWTAFQKNFTALCRISNITAPLFEEALLGLLERFTWSVPSSTVDIPDISLFDHSRTTAGIAACLYRFHQDQGSLNRLEAIKDNQLAKFQFLAGDLSGIQSTLFSLESQGVKGVNKILRARSFMLSAILEAAALQCLSAFDLPHSCMMQQAGGRFLLLVPATEEVPDRLSSLKAKFDTWLYENYTGSLALNLALSRPFSGETFKAGRFQDVMTDLDRSLDESKLHPLSTCAHGVIQREFPYDRSCSACGCRPAERKEGEEYRCKTCQREVAIGRRLINAQLMVLGEPATSLDAHEEVLGLGLALLKHDETPQNLDPIRSLRLLGGESEGLPWRMRIFANYVPRFRDLSESEKHRYDGIDDPDSDHAAGSMKTFAHLGAEALEETDDGHYKGKPFLGLLKADVDFLGFIFSRGFRRDGLTRDRFTLSRLAQLSRMMDLYFSGYLQGLIQREFPDTYTVYAGGDDLLLIGPWRQMLLLTERMQETFAAYTGNNPHITISAGLSLFHPDQPVNRAVHESELFLEKAKKEGRNRVCTIIPTTLSWDRYRERLGDGQWIHDQMNMSHPISTGFVYKLMRIAEDAEQVTKGHIAKAGWRAQLAYALARNIKAANDKERKEKIAQWLQRLGLDEMLKLTAEYPNLYDWRLPLSIALYRNRN